MSFKNNFDSEDWEPVFVDDFMELDPLRLFVQAYLDDSPSKEEFYNQTSNQEFRTNRENLLYEYQLWFAGWNRIPSYFRKQVWREREIASWMLQLRETWGLIPNSTHICVSSRIVKRQRQLVGRVLISGDLTNIQEQLEFQLKHLDLPTTLTIPSIIKEYHNMEVPIEYTLWEPPQEYAIGIVPPNQFMMASDPPPDAYVPTIRAGVRITVENSIGFLKTGTIGAIVSSRQNLEPLLLSNAHVLIEAGRIVCTSPPNSIEIGQVVSVNNQLDAGIAELNDPWLIDYRMKELDMLPAAPVPPYNGMPVQLVGGISGLKTGWVNNSNIMPLNSSKISLSPQISTDIVAVPGDSGSVLLSGHRHISALPSSFSGMTYSAFEESMKAAILGILVAGPSQSIAPTTRPETYFRIINEVLAVLDLQVWVRQI
jgi:hypothetical protein